MPPVTAVAQESTSTPNRSSRCRTASTPPLSANTKMPIRSNNCSAKDTTATRARTAGRIAAPSGNVIHGARNGVRGAAVPATLALHSQERGMHYIVKGLPLASFQPLFGLSDADLAARGIRRMRVDAKPGAPCRITLEDAEPGEHVLLLNWRHLDSASPYRSDGPIFVRESATATAELHDAIPAQQSSRLLSVRAYDAAGWMRDADVFEGVTL